VDARGEVVAHAVYDVWGSPLTETYTDTNFSGTESLLSYATYSWDETLGLWYAQARMYDAELGRFVSEDPAWDGANWYVYAGGNPGNYVDPWGLERIVLSGGAYDAKKRSEDQYNYHFVDSALLQISLWGGEATLLVAYAGWTANQKESIAQAAQSRGMKLVWIYNINDLTVYINSGGKDKRKTDKITHFAVFAHGTDSGTGVYSVTLGYHSGQEAELKWTVSDIYKLDRSAFATDSYSIFYSCRTGNTFKSGNFAQTWANVSGGIVDALYGKKIDTGRSVYDNIIGTNNERRGMKYWWYPYCPSDEYSAWWHERDEGRFEMRPGEAFRLPQAADKAYWGRFTPEYTGGGRK
jgi:RHS repeat-associated protein